MARQVLSPIDLRTHEQRYGTETQTAQAIANILQTLGRGEQKRRERQTLDRVARAISGGKTTVEAIAEAARQEPEFGTGFQGGLQRFGGLFQPGDGIGQSIQQSIIGQALKQALTPKEPFTLTPGAERFTGVGERIAGVEPRAVTPSPSPIMKMVKEGLLTLEEGKEIARKEKEGDLTEKDIISIMHTIERALASTYTVLNEPIGGKKYADRRNYYAQQLDIYRKRLDQLRAGKSSPTPVERDLRLEDTLPPEPDAGMFDRLNRLRPRTEFSFSLDKLNQVYKTLAPEDKKRFESAWKKAKKAGVTQEEFLAEWVK